MNAETEKQKAIIAQKKEILKTLKNQISWFKKNHDKTDIFGANSASWAFQEGAIISINQAILIVEMLKNHEPNPPAILLCKFPNDFHYFVLDMVCNLFYNLQRKTI